MKKPTGKYLGVIPNGTLKYGSKGNRVRSLQRFLNWYHPGWKLAVDGEFGKKTQKAVKGFQKTEKIRKDGIYGNVSARKAKSYKASAPKPTPTPTPAPTPTEMKCIDVSYWQGKISVDSWEKIKKTCGFAICRASYTSLSSFRLSKDSTFETDIQNAKRAGLKVGAYHFSQALSVAEAQKEAEYMCDILDKYKYNVDFWVACDYETNGKGRLNGRTVSTKASDIANAFCEVVEQRGYHACIYANYTMLTKYLKAPKYPIWLAQYNDNKSYDKNVVMWQYTSKGRVDGITASTTNSKSANVDLSYVYEEPKGDSSVTPTPTPTTPTEPTKPTGKYTGTIPNPTLKKGSKGTSVKNLQKFLNWYGKYGLKVDGGFGANTQSALKKFQKAEGLKVDGVYGKQSQARAKTYKAAPNTTPTVTGANAQKLVAEMQKLAWAYGTEKEKYAYKTGAPKEECKTAMEKYGYKTKAQFSDCGDFVNTVVRESGVDPKFTSLHAVKKAFPKTEDKFDIVLSGEAIPDEFLKPGDIIRYKKTNNDQHAMFYFGDNKVCDAGHYNRFGNIRKDEKRYAGSKVKESTIQVLRAK